MKQMAAKMPSVFGKGRGSSSDELRSPLHEALDEDEDLDVEEEEEDPMLADAASEVRAAIKSGDDAALASALKDFVGLCSTPAPKLGK